jgi:hypothetical protein
VGASPGRLGQDPGMNRYEIQVVGHIDPRRAHALGCEECRRLPNGNSILVVNAVDQAATYGVLARLRDAALELVDVRRIEESQAPSDSPAD